MNRNENFVLPKVYLVGYTTIDFDGLYQYLLDSNQEEFVEDIVKAQKLGLSDGEILCSFYAKSCYSSLTSKKNKNISKTRAIRENIISTIESQHGSVFEHCTINFMITDCSRVFTHELVRHRVGTAFSQTSGRYVRTDVLKMVVDPILEPAYERLERLRFHIENEYKILEKELKLDIETDFSKKKKMTSALRRFLPNGQSNEIGFSVNLRTLRQTIEARTSRHSEWEIRNIFNKVYSLLHGRYPAIFLDSKLELIDGEYEITFKNKNI